MTGEAGTPNEENKAAIVLILDIQSFINDVESAAKVLSGLMDRFVAIGAKMAVNWEVDMKDIGEKTDLLATTLASIATNIETVATNIRNSLKDISKSSSAASTSLGTLSKTTVKAADAAFNSVTKFDSMRDAMAGAQVEGDALNVSLGGILEKLAAIGTASGAAKAGISGFGKSAGKGAVKVGGTTVVPAGEGLGEESKEGPTKGGTTVVPAGEGSGEESKEGPTKGERRIQIIEDVASNASPHATSEQINRNLTKELEEGSVATQGEMERLRKSWIGLSEEQRAIREMALLSTAQSYLSMGAQAPAIGEFDKDVLLETQNLGGVLTDREARSAFKTTLSRALNQQKEMAALAAAKTTGMSPAEIQAIRDEALAAAGFTTINGTPNYIRSNAYPRAALEQLEMAAMNIDHEGDAGKVFRQGEHERLLKLRSSDHLVSQSEFAAADKAMRDAEAAQQKVMQNVIRTNVQKAVNSQYSSAGLPFNSASYGDDLMLAMQAHGVDLSPSEQAALSKATLRRSLPAREGSGFSPAQIEQRAQLARQAWKDHIEGLGPNQYITKAGLRESELIAWDAASMASPTESLQAKRIQAARTAPKPEREPEPPRTAFEDLMGNASRGMGRISGPLNMIRHAGMGMMINGAIAAGGFIEAIKSASDFDAALHQVYAVAGERVDLISIEQMRKSLEELAVQTNQTPKELADGLYSIESAGLHGAAALEVLKQAAREATGGQTPLDITAPLFAKTYKAYNLQPQDASHVADIYTKAVTLSLAKPKDFEPAMANVLDTGHKAGLSLNELSSALALITETTKSAATGSTYLKNALGKLIDPTAKMKAEAKSETEYYKRTGKGADLSMIANDKAVEYITEHGFGALIKQMQAASGGKTAAYVKEHGGIEGLANAEQLGKLVPDLRTLQAYLSLVKPGEYDKIFKQISNAAGATTHAFNENMQSWENIWKAITVRAHVFAIDLTQAISGPLRTIAHDVMLVLDWFHNLPPGMQTVITQGIAVAGALTILTGALALLVYAIEPLTILFKTLGGAIAMFGASTTELREGLNAGRGGIELFGAGLLRIAGWIGVCVVAFNLLKTAWDNDSGHIQGGVKDLQTTFEGLFGWIIPAIQGVQSAFSAWGTQTQSVMQGVTVVTLGLAAAIVVLKTRLIEMTAISVVTWLADFVMGAAAAAEKIALLGTAEAATTATTLTLEGAIASVRVAFLSLASAMLIPLANPIVAITVAAVAALGGLAYQWWKLKGEEDQAVESARTYMQVLNDAINKGGQASLIARGQMQETAVDSAQQDLANAKNAIKYDSPGTLSYAANLSNLTAAQDSYDKLHADLEATNKAIAAGQAAIKITHGKDVVSASAAEHKKELDAEVAALIAAGKSPAYARAHAQADLDNLSAQKRAGLLAQAGEVADPGVSGHPQGDEATPWEGLITKDKKGHITFSDMVMKPWNEMFHSLAANDAEAAAGGPMAAGVTSANYEDKKQWIQLNESKNIEGDIASLKQRGVNLTEEEIDAQSKVIEAKNHVASLQHLINIATEEQSGSHAEYNQAKYESQYYDHRAREAASKISSLLDGKDVSKLPDSTKKEVTDLRAHWKDMVGLSEDYAKTAGSIHTATVKAREDETSATNGLVSANYELAKSLEAIQLSNEKLSLSFIDRNITDLQSRQKFGGLGFSGPGGFKEQALSQIQPIYDTISKFAASHSDSIEKFIARPTGMEIGFDKIKSKNLSGMSAKDLDALQLMIDTVHTADPIFNEARAALDKFIDAIRQSGFEADRAALTEKEKAARLDIAQSGRKFKLGITSFADYQADATSKIRALAEIDMPGKTGNMTLADVVDMMAANAGPNAGEAGARYDALVNMGLQDDTNRITPHAHALRNAKEAYQGYIDEVGVRDPGKKGQLDPTLGDHLKYQSALASEMGKMQGESKDLAPMVGQSFEAIDSVARDSADKMAQAWHGAYVDMMKDQVTWAQKVYDDNKRVESAWKESARGIADSFSDSMLSVVEKTSTMGNAVRKMLKSYGEQVFKSLVGQLLTPSIEKAAKGIGHLTHQGPKSDQTLIDNTTALQTLTAALLALQSVAGGLSQLPGGMIIGPGLTAANSIAAAQSLHSNLVPKLTTAVNSIAAVLPSARSQTTSIDSLAAAADKSIKAMTGHAASVSGASNLTSVIGGAPQAAGGDWVGAAQSTIKPLASMLTGASSGLTKSIGAVMPYVGVALALASLIPAAVDKHPYLSKKGTGVYNPGYSKDLLGSTNSGYSGSQGMRDIAERFYQTQRLAADTQAAASKQSSTRSVTVNVHPGAVQVNGIHPGNTQQVADALVDHIATSLGTKVSLENARYGRTG